MSEVKLLLCPFCGGEAKLSLFLGNYHVTCTKCLGAIFPAKGMLKAEAIEAWNTRKPVQKILERLENNSFWTESTYDMDGYCNDDSEEVVYLDKAIQIVKEVGGIDG